LRYTILAYLGARYGGKIIGLIVKYSHPVVVGVILAAVAIAVAGYYFWPRKSRKSRPPKSPQSA
jgi:hypothetical protein